MYMDNYSYWLENEYFDKETKNELLGIKGDSKEIEDRFFKDLEFGTGGLRGVIGSGTNRMNKYTVRRSTQGLANYILKTDKKGMDKGVAIAYDSRRKSHEFAREAALVLNGNGIKSYIFDDIRTTPQLSFAVRELGCIAGIVITASHNPPEYNGYKVYWEDGGQIVPELAKEIIAEVNAISDYASVNTIDYKEALERRLYNVVPEAMDDKFIRAVKAQCINPDIIQQAGVDMKIVFTPLHGTGNIPVRRVLKETGFQNVIVVKEQEEPDSSFPTVKYPNPEEKEAMELAIRTAQEHNADLALGTDPDGDRVGVVTRDYRGNYVVLTGNQTGALLVDYILSGMNEKGMLPEDGVIVKTIVTSELGRVIADSFNIETIDTLTGFKFIGEKIKEFEENGDKTFIFGYEESFGYLAGTHARDKDGVVASLLICEMAAYYKSKGLSLYDALMNLYEKYGYYIEDLKSITLKGKDGLEKMKEIMNRLRDNPPEELAGRRIAEIRDYLNGIRVEKFNGAEVKTNGAEGERKKEVTEKMSLPSSDVLYFKTDDNSWVCIRPSGTEPKIKIYFSVTGSSMDEVYSKLNRLKEGVRFEELTS